MKSLSLDCSSFSDQSSTSDIVYTPPVTTVQPAPPPPPPPANVTCYLSSQAVNSFVIFNYQLTSVLPADLYLSLTYSVNGGFNRIFNFVVPAGQRYGSEQAAVKALIDQSGTSMIVEASCNDKDFLPTVVSLVNNDLL